MKIQKYKITYSDSSSVIVPHSRKYTHSSFSSLVQPLLPKDTLFKNIILLDFTTAGDWDCVAAVERLHALHYSVDFIFLSFGIMGFIVEL